MRIFTPVISPSLSPQWYILNTFQKPQSGLGHCVLSRETHHPFQIHVPSFHWKLQEGYPTHPGGRAEPPWGGGQAPCPRLGDGLFLAPDGPQGARGCWGESGVPPGRGC